MITGRVYISLRREPDFGNESCDRRALEQLSACPDGAEALVDIGDRQYVSEDAAVWLRKHERRLAITIQGTDARVVKAFVSAARLGSWQVVA